MRRFFLLALVLLLTGCSSRERQALSYLGKQFPGAAFTVEDVGPVISLYYPGHELTRISRLAAGHVKGSGDEFEQACEHFEAAMDPQRYATDNPDECGHKGFTACVYYPGGTLDVTFFYADGKTREIFSSTMELQERYDDILKTAFGL